jgi:gamma-glutamyltranspeptidase
MSRVTIVAAASALAACATLSNVTPLGGDAFMTVVHSNDVNARVEEQRGKATAQAAAYCKERGASLDVIRVVAAAPPFGQPPSAEVDFRCTTAP